MAGTPIGLRDLYYAELIEDTLAGVTYGAPVRVVGAITANINPNSQSGTLFADDGPLDTVSSLGEIELELSAADIPAEVQAIWLGHTVDSGIIKRKSTDVPKYVAIGFKSLKSNGAYRYVWLVKGKFQEPEQRYETKGESVNFQPPTLVGRFVSRDFDQLWQKSIDSDHESYDESVGTAWFTAVEPAGA
jgi:phi13 family phage major tail protein